MGGCFAAFPGTLAEAVLEVPQHKMAAIWDTGTAGKGLMYNIVAPAPRMYFSVLVLHMVNYIHRDLINTQQETEVTDALRTRRNPATPSSFQRYFRRPEYQQATSK